MSLAPGTTIGVYEISGSIGAGGMGEVYRARDRKLNRDVAIKVLPESFAHDADRVARFTREAQTLASLNHSNIAHIYDAGTTDDVTYLVMELVDGEDLSTQIARGAVPLAEALPIARQIADALEAAHEQGIVHRDLKPANIKVRPDGTVKVLDFGLAKALGPAGPDESGTQPSNSPTMTARATQMGMILGTAAYMSPEQARGKAVDRRADIWAFGVVLYEMLTGRRAFEGAEVTDVFAAVLRAEPNLDALPAGTPTSVRRVLRRCLEKDPRKRLSAIGDARLELDEHDPIVASAAIVPAPRSLAPILWAAVAGIFVAAAAMYLFWRPAPVAPALDPARLSLLGPAGLELYADSNNVAISPDGKMVAFVAGKLSSPETQLWVRSLDSLTARRLEEGDGASLPFWSPDSKRVAFFARQKLKAVSVADGRVEVLTDAPGPRGGTWNPANVIVFARDAGGPLYRVSGNGGEATPVTTIDASRKQSAHRFPVFLPDGEHFIFAALPGHNGKFDIFAGALSGGTPALIGAMESTPVYAEPGWLLFTRRNTLVAQAFDARTLELSGEAMPLGDQPTSVMDPAISFTAGHAVSVSRQGSLAYFSAASPNTAAVWLNANGQPDGTLNVPAGEYSSVQISPDGTQAIFVKSISPSESNLWLVDLGRGSASPLTSIAGRSDSAVWSPDGKRIVFASDREGPQDLFIKTVGDASPEQLFYKSDVLFKNPTSWSPDDKWIAYQQLDRETAHNIWLLPTTGAATPKPYIQNRGRDDGGPFSPDGHWLAYLSDDTGRTQLFVQSFPEPGRGLQISTDSAVASWWTHDSRALIYVSGDLGSLWRVDIEPGPTMRVGNPKQLGTLPPHVAWIDAMPDRRRFLVLMPERPGAGSMTVVQHWPGLIK